MLRAFHHRLVSNGAMQAAKNRTDAASFSSPFLRCRQRGMPPGIPKIRHYSSSLSPPLSSSSSSSTTASTTSTSPITTTGTQDAEKRIWRAGGGTAEQPLHWSDDVASNPGDSDLSALLERIEKQELQGGRMRTRQRGVLHEDPIIDMRMLTENYTVKTLASALRDREEVLQHCAQLAEKNDMEGLKKTLAIFHPDLVLERRRDVRRLDLSTKLTGTALETIRKALMRMPRRVTQAHSKRAGVVLAMCHVNGVPSLLMEKRAASLRAHPDEICLPGGMFCSVEDKSIVETCLREMKEEIGGLPFDHKNGFSGINVLGVLRCNWGNVHHLVGVAVTPVVAILQEDLASYDLKPNADEVAEVFTVPMKTLLDGSKWIHKDDHAPIFIGGPYAIWGLTGYILERFVKDILLPHHVKHSSH
eukprot:CAMPEP_0119563342 /NCGR_PEP_ID=MMETSP1352-20130426/23112_1 /TAXON_ID=265584 /ORGANISM="Stauroneis constricta, Strain CCMP1120" /LENGTH=416 /DNA_ID=CAMNT_0007611919 /DNA_START=108 /DNA_END=1358 /DNA_ORIENTATION=-